MGCHKNTGASVRLVSVHLDSDNAETRRKELRSLLNTLPEKENTVDIIMGDFNCDFSACYNTNAASFTSLLPALGHKNYTSMPRYVRYENGGRLDHIIFRQGLPISGKVYHAGILKSLPNPWQEDERLAACLRDIGSDHFPVLGTIGLQQASPLKDLY